MSSDTKVASEASGKSSCRAWTTGDIIHAAALLRRKLPGDLVCIIIDYAGLWTTITATHQEMWVQIQPREPYNVGHLLLRCVMPSGMPSNMVRTITFTIRKRDQSWRHSSGDTIIWLGGPAECEAGICKESIMHASNPNPELERDLDSETTKSVSQPGPIGVLGHVGQNGDEVPRWKIPTELHDWDTWKTYTVVWSCEDRVSEIAQAVRRLTAGDSIELSAFARYPGYESMISFVSIDVNGVYIRKL